MRMPHAVLPLALKTTPVPAMLASWEMAPAVYPYWYSRTAVISCVVTLSVVYLRAFLSVSAQRATSSWKGVPVLREVHTNDPLKHVVCGVWWILASWYMFLAASSMTVCNGETALGYVWPNTTAGTTVRLSCATDQCKPHNMTMGVQL